MDFKNTLLLRTIAFFKTPMVAFLGVSVEELSDKRCVVKIPVRFRSKNPAGSMFLGALTSGADVAGSLAAYATVRKLKASVSILFKDMQATFIKKAVDHVLFICEDMAVIEEAVKKTVATGEAVQLPVFVKAYGRKNLSEPVATFVLTLSMKRRGK